MTNRAYDLIRSLVEGHGGSMVFEREGYSHGAWVIKMGDKVKIIEAGGIHSLPELDRLYVPRVAEPRSWDDYSNQLVPDAEAKLFVLLGLNPFPNDVANELRALIGRAKWKFSWTLARTYPHEYTTKALSSADDHARLIDWIEQYGIVERFGDTRRKYFHFEERKYWHMGDPYSDNPEAQPNVINRTWLDVRRHADNVRHVWTPEEVELQMRLWEIQLEKNTDYIRPSTSP